MAPPEIGVSQSTLRYRVLVLGPFALEREGERIDVGRWQHRVQTLFLLLATAPDRQRRRDDLMDVLWPDAAPDNAATNLRILVHRLRLALGRDPSPVLSNHGWIRLNPVYGWELDLDEMDALVRMAQSDPDVLCSAVALYRGEPLIEHRYEDWAMPVLDRAQRIWRDACLQLASICRAHGQYEDAGVWYRRLLEVDPLDEETVHGLMLSLGNAGKPGEAVRQFERFKERLAAEIDATPDSELARLAESFKLRLTDAAAAPPTLLPASSLLGARPDGPLIDRHDELERALLAGDAVEAGSGRLILIAGEEGVGKTRLAQEVLIRLEERGFLALATRCFERHQAVPFAAFLDLLALVYAAAPASLRIDALRRWPEMAWLLPEGVAQASEDVPEEPDEQRALFRAASGFLAAAAHDRPMVMLLEDLQWADEGSLDLLRYLAQQMRGSRILLLAEYCDVDISREHPLGKAARELVRDGLADRIALVRLGPDETAALIAASLGGERPPAEFAEFVYRRTKGNPYYVRRMIEALGGRYRLVRQIAAGGMGRVFEAIDSETGDRVAAKIMFARTEADPRALLRFRQEGVALASLRHLNIVRVHTTLVEEHASCIVMDLVEGRTLSDVLHHDRMSLPRVKRLVLQVASALTAAHERSIVHRDIKPSNIMVGVDDHVTVTDFGIARLVRPAQEASTTVSMTSTGMSLGTPLYMAPEQIQGEKVDQRADIYSLGAVLYHIVTGRPLFEGSDPVTMAYKQVHEPPVPPRALRHDLPGEWENVILRALAKAPADRFQTAMAMASAISGLAVPDDVPDAAEQAGTAEHTPIGTGKPGAAVAPSGTRARTVFAALGGLAVAVLVAVLVIAPMITASGSSGSSGTGPGQFNGPTGLVADDKGNVYVADEWNNRVQELSPTGVFVRQWRTLGPGSLPILEPSDITWDPNTGDLFVSDLVHRRIVRIHNGRQVYAIAVDAGSLALGPRGDLFASAYAQHIIRRFRWARYPENPIPIPGVAAASLAWPAGIATDRQGRLYIADRVNNRIVRFSPDGTPLPSIGHFGQNPGEFRSPSDVAVAENDEIYVADTGNNRIQLLSSQGTPLGSWNGAQVGGLDHPVSVAVDWKYDVFVSDYKHTRVIGLTQTLEPLWYSHGQQPVTVK